VRIFNPVSKNLKSAQNFALFEIFSLPISLGFVTKKAYTLQFGQ
jgi:hypothetical protein